MKPLNRAERNNAFWGFLLLFLITLGVVVAVVFFSVQVPFKQNEQLRNEMFLMQNNKVWADSFNVVMREAINELNRYNEKKEPAFVIQQKVKYKINKMSDLINHMPDADNSIYPLMAQSIDDLNNEKARLQSLEESRNFSQNP